ncbi:Gfo/Idh/MocA family protein [Paraferrimonas sedimenticola]|uniref:Oxidoreductase n=1 Tax=Paraferrimonas sedimenticola TaxID=375674 RepID=A0AA37W047_9GAMM|nr:Gfo/Idh/MocA family oxidoreductase [Paraferrimonas sedimenticola]GLP95905.1 oxidoreductase [Paraferrimonas sedimenticola]
MKTIRWGILGAGRISEQFVSDLQRVEGCAVTAVAARSLKSAQDFAERHNIAQALEGYQALYQHADVDIIYIATPHTCHFEQASAALNAGKHVLCEKPMTVSLQQSKQLADIAKANNCYLMEGMWTWFLPAIRQAQDWIAQGRIGAIKHIKADFGYPIEYHPRRREYDAELAGGSLFEMGIYPVALAWLLTGRAPNARQVMARHADNGVADDIIWQQDYGDCYASLATSFRCKQQNWAYIIGDEGYIAIPDFWRAHRAELYHLDEMVEHFEEHREGFGFQHQATAVCEDLRAGLIESQRVSLADSHAFQAEIADINAIIAEQQ